MAQESWNCDAAEGGGCQQQQESLVLCPNNCGLFGCPATMNLCPKCFGELILTKQGEKVVAAIAASVQKSPTSAAPTTSAPVSLVGKVPEICTSSQASSTVEIRIFSPTDKPVEPIPSPPLLRKSPLPSSHASTLLSVPDLGPLATLFSSDDQKSQSPALKQSVNRCFNCRKRTGLLGFKCRCGYVFCAQHRYSDKHGCSFDYKSAGREAIAKANPIVKASKVERSDKCHVLCAIICHGYRLDSAMAKNSVCW